MVLECSIVLLDKKRTVSQEVYLFRLEATITILIIMWKNDTDHSNSVPLSLSTYQSETIETVNRQTPVLG